MGWYVLEKVSPISSFLKVKLWLSDKKWTEEFISGRISRFTKIVINNLGYHFPLSYLCMIKD
jgi:hypothetical protein